ncbi:MAG: hypothetical protein COY19_08575 [Candidatus Marinimicrobia bacterium CG_4_10_14_0_2_um_filter_48_9]|nr:MAG: hypothetical protein COY19_08575 [Candidatus Marinimicrobia bacterium CG_4_10_14_0_2_um_filter_48_9]PJA51519.1 MAG: hypothetical protein CO167_13585 [Candidatus Marinimicrobia bacterium CG_4_9_14_3_um_filter_48_9]
MLTLKLAVISVLMTGIVFWLLQKKKERYLYKKWRILLTGSLLLTGALFWLGYESTRLSFNIGTRDWEKLQGIVVQSKVVGKRAVHPEITIRYQVDDLSRTFTTDLFAPGFGVRSNRRDQAEKLVAAYSPGDTVIIHVNPHNMLEARLHVGPTWDIFVRLALSIFLLISGVWHVLRFFWSTGEKSELSTGRVNEK